MIDYNFIEHAIEIIKKHAKNVSEATKNKYYQQVYLMGAEFACDVLKEIACDDVIKVVRCGDCKNYDPENEICNNAWGLSNPYCSEFCSLGERKENAD